MNILYLITARGGSKGLPRKNINLLKDRPLINYTIDIARELTTDNNICVSTDSTEIIDVVEATGLKVPFVRPEQLALDTSGSNEVILHALDFYESRGIKYDAIMLLQPTSPFRKVEDLLNMVNMFNYDLDMVVSVCESHLSPYFTLFEEDEFGYLAKSKEGRFDRRQDAPKVYAYNGSAYLINVKSIKKNPLHTFRKVKKYVMDEILSIDIDTPLDWLIAETILINKIFIYK